MTDQRGTFEHALFTEPRPEHGYCSDDMARVLIVVAREADHLPAMRNLAMLSLRFLQDARLARQMSESDGQIRSVGGLASRR